MQFQLKLEYSPKHLLNYFPMSSIKFYLRASCSVSVNTWKTSLIYTFIIHTKDHWWD